MRELSRMSEMFCTVFGVVITDCVELKVSALYVCYT